VHTKNRTFDVALVQEIKADSSECLEKPVATVSHQNIVRLVETFYNEGIIFRFYEMMETSLTQVFPTPKGRLQEGEVAAFCMEILRGIEYIHNVLNIAYGEINSNNVLVAGMAPSS
jgi:serine/threonine protein kinase